MINVTLMLTTIFTEGEGKHKTYDSQPVMRDAYLVQIPSRGDCVSVKENGISCAYKVKNVSYVAVGEIAAGIDISTAEAGIATPLVCVMLEVFNDQRVPDFEEMRTKGWK